MDKIYSATYSGVEVYEYLTASGSVMMRKSDGWVNATHILKTANFPKAKRTRILERDVQVGIHDKVQGGYGKYQGTYVPLERAQNIAAEFGVAVILRPLFEAQEVFADVPPPPAPKHHHASKNNSITSDKPPSQRKAALARKVASMPITANGDRKKKAKSLKKPDSRVSNPNEGVFVRRRVGQQLPPLRMTDSLDDEGDTDVDDDTGMESEAELNENDGLDSDIDSSQLQLIDATSSPSEFMSDADLANALLSPSQQVNQNARESLERAMTSHTDTLRHENWIDPNTEFTARLLDLFIQPDDPSVESGVPDFLLHPPKGVNLDQVIDDEGNTTFHWACSMSNPQIVEVLINMGANYRAVNNAGETPLMRAVKFTNAYTKRTFSRLVDMLSENIFEFDSNHRTVLHHIAAAASSKPRIVSALHYMQVILGKVAESQTPQRLEDFVNVQDQNGDTAVHICARNANRKCIKFLIENKAKGNLRNNTGRQASELLLENQSVTPRVHQRYEMHLKSKGPNPQIPTPANSTANTTSNGTAVAAPHVSEAAIEATHKVAQIMMESLQELSNAYDYELQRKEADVTEVQELVANMNGDIRNINDRTSEYLGEPADEKAISQRLELIEDQIKRHVTLVNTKETKLRRMVERSQKKKLETLVARLTCQPNDATDSLAEAIELSKLQLKRKRLVSEVLDLSAGVNDASDKMQKYRRLVCIAADIPLESGAETLDELLKEIENVDAEN